MADLLNPLPAHALGPAAQLNCPLCGEAGVRGSLLGSPVVAFYEDIAYTKRPGFWARVFGTTPTPLCARAAWSAVTCKHCRLVWFKYPAPNAHHDDHDS